MGRRQRPHNTVSIKPGIVVFRQEHQIYRRVLKTGLGCKVLRFSGRRAPNAAAPSGEDPVMTELNRYKALHDAGFMTDEAVNLIRMVSTPEELENIL